MAVDVLAAYIQWRGNPPLVADAYERWRGAALAEKSGDLAAYGAELDEDEAMAKTYAKAILELERWSARR